MKWLVKTRRVGLAVGTHAGPQLGGWEVALDFVVGIAPWTRALVVGWGYDMEVPLRPWPRVWMDKTSPSGKNITTGLAWCGFFFTAGRPA